MQRQDGGGVIINIGSVVAVPTRRPAPPRTRRPRRGLTVLTRALALEFGPEVRVNQVTVGLVRTETADDYYGDEAGQDRVARTIPMRRMADPGRHRRRLPVAVSPLAGYVSGAELVVDGGGEIPSRHLAAQPPGTGPLG